jgi:hypothetical protein
MAEIECSRLLHPVAMAVDIGKIKLSSNQSKPSRIFTKKLVEVPRYNELVDVEIQYLAALSSAIALL